MLDKEANTETIIADGQRETSFWFFSLNTYYMCPKCDFFLISLLWVGFLLAATKSPDEYRCRDQCNVKFLSSYTLYHFRYHKKSPSWPSLCSLFNRGENGEELNYPNSAGTRTRIGFFCSCSKSSAPHTCYQQREDKLSPCIKLNNTKPGSLCDGERYWMKQHLFVRKIDGS